MLNYNFLRELHDNLPIPEKKKLQVLLFKKSKQSIAYFANNRDISLSKLEILADYFHLPLDAFRLENELSGGEIIAAKNKRSQNAGAEERLMSEIQNLRDKNKLMAEIIEGKDEVLKAKNELLASKIEEINTLRSTLTRTRFVGNGNPRRSYSELSEDEIQRD